MSHECGECAQAQIKTLCGAVRNFLETVATRAASPEDMAAALEALLPDWKAPDGPALLVCDGWATDRIGEEQAENAALRARLDLADRLANAIHNYDAALEPNPWDVEWQCVDEALAAYRASAGK